MKITNNQGIVMELDDKMIEVLSIVYSVGEYQMVAGDYKEAENFLIQKGYVLWAMFQKKLQPNETHCKHILGEILSQWEDDMLGNKILTNLFGHLEN